MIQLTPLSDRLTKRFQPAPHSVEVYSCVAIGHVHCVCTYDIFIFAAKLLGNKTIVVESWLNLPFVDVDVDVDVVYICICIICT